MFPLLLKPYSKRCCEKSVPPMMPDSHMSINVDVPVLKNGRPSRSCEVVSFSVSDRYAGFHFRDFSVNTLLMVGDDPSTRQPIPLYRSGVALNDSFVRQVSSIDPSSVVKSKG